VRVAGQFLDLRRCSQSHFMSLRVFSKVPISLWWPAWVLLVVVTCGAWLLSFDALDRCFVRSNTGLDVCLENGKVLVGQGVVLDRAPHWLNRGVVAIPLWLLALLAILSAPVVLVWRAISRAFHVRRWEQDGFRCAFCGQGLVEGASVCPRCGRDIHPADLQEGLTSALRRDGPALDRWQASSRTWWRRALMPWRVGLAPIRAFRRWCPMDRVLTESPKRTLPWIVVALVALVIFGDAVWYAVDVIRGRYPVFGGHHRTLGMRFGSLKLLPVHLPILWLQSVAVCLIGMVIGWRRLSACGPSWSASRSSPSGPRHPRSP